jgi:UDP-N-acetylmuramyl-tripeptide synthetase
MRLGDLIDLSGPTAALASLDIKGLSVDSRKVRAGEAFFAIGGARQDGLAFAGQAVANGAALVLSERPPGETLGADHIVVADVRAALAKAAARFYPRQPETIVAITGTSGKTSIAAFVRQIWARLGLEAASLGTIGIVSNKLNDYSSLTTPDPIALHKALDELARAGVTHLALEASSHGLDQKRLDGVRLAAGAFTNLSRDHLDYHPTLDDYFAAKLRLFTTLLPAGAPIVFDADSDIAPGFAEALAARAPDLLGVGAKGLFITLKRAEREGFSTRLKLAHAGRHHDVPLPLVGAFQVSNALVAAGLCIATGGNSQSVFAALSMLEGAPGRLEKVGERHGAPVFVDYAHKPDALEKALNTLRPFVDRRLIVVFGCGGDRDPGKRAMMGEIAARCADVVIVTDDNPRSENPAAIRAAILAAAPGAREIDDRGEAIRAAVRMLESGDALLIAGKGHETGQIIGDSTLAFSDHEAARAALEESL